MVQATLALWCLYGINQYSGDLLACDRGLVTLRTVIQLPHSTLVASVHLSFVSVSLSLSPFLPFGSKGPVFIFYLSDSHIVGRLEFTTYYARFT